MYNFFVNNDDFTEDKVTITNDFNHIKNVLRLKTRRRNLCY